MLYCASIGLRKKVPGPTEVSSIHGEIAWS
jgi:hypothetical protein